MVETYKIKFGVDIVGQVLQLAGCNCSGGRVVIDSLSQNNLKEIKPEMINSPGRLQFSVPEDQAIIKRIKVASEKNLDGEKLAEFEFSSTLLDKKETLYIKANLVNGGSEYLVFGCHKNLIDKRDQFFEKLFMKPAGYKLRALALADGYQNYCWREGGELICLLDLSPTVASYCFINNSQPAFVGSISNDNTGNGEDDPISESFLSDLKVTIQYQMSNLFKAGYSTPLSLIVVTGTLAGKEANKTIEERLRLRTISPTIKTALFAPEIVDRAGRFLVSLGLTIDN